MENRIEIINIHNRKDFLSADKVTAISAEGYIFNVGDKVTHEGDEFNRVGTIISFEFCDTNDILALTEHGNARISFLDPKI